MGNKGRLIFNSLVLRLFQVGFSDLKSQGVTYHLGDDRSWQGESASHRMISLQNVENAYRLEGWLKICEFTVDTNANDNAPETRNVVYQGNSLPCTRLAYK
jgi:hypothetical protein